MSLDLKSYTKGKYLKGADLDPDERLIITIQSAFEETFPPVGDQPERKTVALNFLEIDQIMTLNRTQIAALIAIHGDDTEEWPGQQILLYRIPAKTPQGAPTFTLVIERPRKVKTKVTAPPPPEDDVEFMAATEA